jgi:GNAT superfamily N-acetyltransferase
MDEETAEGDQMYFVYVDPTPEPSGWEGGEVHFTIDGTILAITESQLGGPSQKYLSRDKQIIKDLFTKWYADQPMYKKYKLKWMKSLKEASERAEAWIEKMYAKYPSSPLNGNQRAIVYNDGQEFAFFELEPSKSSKDGVELKWFQAYPMRQGVGTKALKQIQDDAKADGIVLTLFPWQHGRVSQASLMRFYKRVGFKPSAKGSKNMIWNPDK